MSAEWDMKSENRPGSLVSALDLAERRGARVGTAMCWWSVSPLCMRRVSFACAASARVQLVRYDTLQDR